MVSPFGPCSPVVAAGGAFLILFLVAGLTFGEEVGTVAGVDCF